MIGRILLAVDDSPAALACARLAVRLAAEWHAALRAVHVVADGELTATLATAGREEVARRRGAAGDALLAHVARLGRRAGVEVDPVLLLGEPAQCVLDEARSWHPDVIVLGRARSGGVGQPYIGHQTQRVLEFAEQPVLVVPTPRPDG